MENNLKKFLAILMLKWVTPLGFLSLFAVSVIWLVDNYQWQRPWYLEVLAVIGMGFSLRAFIDDALRHYGLIK